jgi:hypothetical protein
MELITTGLVSASLINRNALRFFYVTDFYEENLQGFIAITSVNVNSPESGIEIYAAHDAVAMIPLN